MSSCPSLMGNSFFVKSVISHTNALHLAVSYSSLCFSISMASLEKSHPYIYKFGFLFFFKQKLITAPKQIASKKNATIYHLLDLTSGKTVLPTPHPTSRMHAFSSDAVDGSMSSSGNSVNSQFRSLKNLFSCFE